MKSKRFLLLSAIVPFLVLGLSLRVTQEEHPAGLAVSAPDFSPIVSSLQTLQTGTLHLNYCTTCMEVRNGWSSEVARNECE